MSRKRAKKEAKAEKPAKRPKGRNRAEVVLAIVATDNTFDSIVKAFPEFHMYPAAWMGKCIHCNTKVFVTDQGNTDATIEHIKPLCDEGDSTDPHNLALACSRCNNEKGI